MGVEIHVPLTKWRRELAVPAASVTRIHASHVHEAAYTPHVLEGIFVWNSVSNVEMPIVTACAGVRVRVKAMTNSFQAPVLAFTIFAQRGIVRGLMSRATKG